MYITSANNGVDTTKVLTLRRDGLNYIVKNVGGSTFTVTENEYTWLMFFNGDYIEVDEDLGLNLSRIACLVGDSIFMEDGEEIELNSTQMTSLKTYMNNYLLEDEIDAIENVEPPIDHMNYHKL